MSAFDFTARALARRSAAQSPLSFAELGAARLPAHVNRIDSSGHAGPGHGAGSYIADAAIDAALAAAHPLAVFEGAAGRRFRLIGDAQGFITPEQLGCPAYAPGTDQRPWIQAAIDYAQAFGLAGVVFAAKDYELWLPERISGFDFSKHDGEFLVVSKPIALVSSHPMRTQLNYKGRTGGSLLTDYQTFYWPNSYIGNAAGDFIWRGSAIKLAGIDEDGHFQTPYPDDRDLAGFCIRNIIFHSDAVGVRNTAWPALPESRDPTRVNCWDVTNKGIYWQHDRQIGFVHLENVDIIGFLGECIYTQNYTVGGLTGRNLTMKHSNGQALNLNGPKYCDIDGVHAENCGFTMEGWAGLDNARVINAKFVNCGQGGITGGATAAGERRADGSAPILEFGAVFQNCGTVRFGRYVQGKVIAIDTKLELFSAGANALVHDCNLDIVAVCDQSNFLTALRMATASSSQNEAITNNVVNLHCHRTNAARAAGRAFGYVFNQSGKFGPGNYVHVSGESAKAVTSLEIASNWNVSVTGLETIEYSASPGYAVSFDPATTPSPDFKDIFLRPAFSAGSSGLYPVNLPALTYYNHGAELLLEHMDGASPSAVLNVGGLALLGYRDRLKLRADKRKGRWEVVGAPGPIRATASLAVPVTARGAEVKLTVPLPGARPDHRTSVTPAATLTGFAITAVRAGTDAVDFWVRNVDGDDPASLAAQDWTAKAWIAAR